MGGDVVEVGLAGLVAAHALTVVAHRQILLAVLTAARDGHLARPGVNGVLDELRHRLQRVVLRQRDDGDGVPVVANAQLAAGFRLSLLVCHGTSQPFGSRGQDGNRGSVIGTKAVPPARALATSPALAV